MFWHFENVFGSLYGCGGKGEREENRFYPHEKKKGMNHLNLLVN
jgi:hypothetical protein